MLSLSSFSEERSCSCQCEAEFPTFREDTSACVETVQGGFFLYGCDDDVGRVDEDEHIWLCCNKQDDHDCDEQLKKGDLSCAMRRNINRKPKLKVHCPHDQHDHAYKAHVAM